MLVAAARAGVVLTCVTQAQRLGLWVLETGRPHVAARPHSGRAPLGTAVVHWSAPVVPRHPDSLIDSVENVLVAVAACQPLEAALAIWESALRQGRAQRAALARLALPSSARHLLETADLFSDSGLETFVVPRLRWLGLPLRRQIWIGGHRVDLLIGERLVLQIDGGHHVGAQRDADIAHDAALMLLGYHVIRVSYRQVVDGWHEVQETIMRAIAQGLHLPEPSRRR
jgi:very-short-patch-repair endonuclease